MPVYERAPKASCTLGHLNDLIDKAPGMESRLVTRASGFTYSEVDEACQFYYGESFEERRTKVFTAHIKSLGKTPFRLHAA